MTLSYENLGQSEARCVVVIENDQIHEDPEQFRLVLGTPTSESAGNALLGTQKEALITINDIADSKYRNTLKYVTIVNITSSFSNKSRLV